jgi:LCP family protein required for cell wall assembly
MKKVTGERAERRSAFLRVLRLTLLALPLPGLALLLAGRRRVGAVVLAASAAVGLAVAAFVGEHGISDVATRLGSSPDMLAATAWLAIAGGLAWVLAIIATAASAWPSAPSRVQKVVATTLTSALCLAVAAPAALTTRYALISRTVTEEVFAAEAPVRLDKVPVAAPQPAAKVVDPWAGTPRVNVLLLGVDAAPGRSGVRPDSIMVASIDTATGDTVLFGIPRNLENVPFPESSPLHDLWPHGFTCGSECLLNAVWTEGVDHADRFPRDPNPGLTATRSAVEAILGLRVDYTVTATLQAFGDIVDAVGGVEVTVKERLPIGGSIDADGRVLESPKGYIEPGRQRLDGYRAQWFTRSRFASSDFDRMGRQRCMIGALTEQVNPLRILVRFPAIAAATGKNLRTDIPLSDLPAWAELGHRVQAGTLTSLPLTDKVIHPGRPDFRLIRKLVREAVPGESKVGAAAAPKAPKTSTAPAGDGGGARPGRGAAPTAPQPIPDSC